MEPMIQDRYFNDKPARDSSERIGRLIGDVVGIGVMVALAWAVLRHLL